MKNEKKIKRSSAEREKNMKEVNMIKTVSSI